MNKKKLQIELDELYAQFGKKQVYELLSKQAGYETVPPTIDEFINDPEFLGDIYGYNKDTKKPTVYPYWQKALNDVFPDPFNSPYVEVITTGATGQGKSLFSMIGALYDLCKLLHVKNPHSKYALAKTDKITLMLMNATMSLSKSVLYEQMLEAMHISPYFKKKMALAGKFSLFEKNIDIDFGSRASNALGRAVFATIISEINFQNKTANQAKDNYNGIVSRFRSRFETDFAYPGRIWIDSSKTETGSFIEDTLLKGRDLKREGVIVFDNPRWEVLPPWKLPANTFDKHFHVFKGNESRDPFIIDREAQREGIDDSEIVKVPHIYEIQFRNSVQKGLQDIAGISTQAGYRFIPSVEKIDSCLSIDKNGHVNPVIKETIALDGKDERDCLINYIDFKSIPPDSRPRFIHMDLSYASGGDKTGIASTRLDGIATIERLDPFTMKVVKIHEPLFYTDFVLSIEAKADQEIPLYKIENLFIDLKHRGYKIAMITADGFASKQMLQNLERKGFKVDNCSVDKTFDPYLDFKSAILMEAWKGPYHPLLIEEIKRLEVEKGKKVNHTPDFSKDLSDAVAGSIHMAKKMMADMRANIKTEDFTSALANVNKPKNVYDELIEQFQGGQINFR